VPGKISIAFEGVNEKGVVEIVVVVLVVGLKRRVVWRIGLICMSNAVQSK
jgi:hypothetical protein